MSDNFRSDNRDCTVFREILLQIIHASAVYLVLISVRSRDSTL
jgi:hypothetical protein